VLSTAQYAWQQRNPEKARAHRLVKYAVKTGKLIKPSVCPRCGLAKPVQAHHPDYSKPLEVDWMCEKCHNEIPKPKKHNSKIAPEVIIMGATRGSGSIVTRKGTSLLYIRYYVDGPNGKRIQKQEPTGSDDRAVAEKLLRERLVDTERGAVAPADVNQLRYEDIRDSYFRESPEQKTYPGLKHLDEFFAGMKIPRISTDTLRDFIEERRDEDEAADPTIRRNLVALRAMFNQARKDGKLGQRDVPHFPMPKDSEAAGQYIEPEQFQKILNGLDTVRAEKIEKGDKNPPDLKPFFSFMYGTGCRLGALRKITWGMVSGEKRDVINLPASIIKTKKPLMIVLDGKLLAPIAEMIREMAHPKNSDGTISMGGIEDSKIVFDSTNFRPEWSKACAKAGVGTYDSKTRTRTGVRIHDCRCSAAINLLDAGVDEGTVLKIGGWKTRAMLDRYNVQNEKRVRKAMQTGGDFVAARMGVPVGA